MGRIVCLSTLQPATRAEIRKRIARYEMDLLSCVKDLNEILLGKWKNGNPDTMPNAVHVLRDECQRRVSHYIPALKELYWVIGVPIPPETLNMMEIGGRFDESD